MLINNKMKQVVGGNWGKPKGPEQNVKLRDIDLEPRRIPGKKKRKTKKQKFIFEGPCCPFCHAELPKDEEAIAKANKELQGRSCVVWEMHYRVKVCPKCNALEVKECPACKRTTWRRQAWYKHQFLGCGFEGKKLKD
ncbi:MAG: hypothetical protein WCO69_00775 [Candidatus Omnitrophota bacterium]